MSAKAYAGLPLGFRNRFTWPVLSRLVSATGGRVYGCNQAGPSILQSLASYVDCWIGRFARVIFRIHARITYDLGKLPEMALILKFCLQMKAHRTSK